MTMNRLALSGMLQKVKRILLRRGVAVDDVDDIVNDAFVRILQYEKANTVRTHEAILVTTAVNLSIDRERARSRASFLVRSTNLHAIIDTQPSPEDIADARARLLHLRAGVDQLADKSRRIILARRLEGQSVAAISESEGISTAAVEKQIARATLRLRRWMDDYDARA